jgi:hypothetical protein
MELNSFKDAKRRIAFRHIVLNEIKRNGRKRNEMGGKKNKEYLILSEYLLHARHSGTVPVKTLLTANPVTNKEENFLSKSAVSNSLNQLEN